MVKGNQINLEVDAQLHREFKLAVLNNNTSISAVLRESMKRYIAETKKNVIY